MIEIEFDGDKKNGLISIDGRKLPGVTGISIGLLEKGKIATADVKMKVKKINIKNPKIGEVHITTIDGVSVTLRGERMSFTIDDIHKIIDEA